MSHVDAHDGRSERLEVLLAIAFRRRLPRDLLRQVIEAADLSRRGDQVLANLRLAFEGLSRIPTSDGVKARIAMADKLLNHGMAPDELLRALGSDVRTSDNLTKFDPNQPRVPSNNGPESGRWTKDDGVSTGPATALVSAIALRAAPLLAPDLAVTTMGALTALAGVVGFAAIAGVLFVPSANSVSTSGPLPGKSGNNYSYDHDEGLLRVLSATGEILAAGHRDGSGVFYDANTGVPFARELNGSLLFDDAAGSKTEPGSPTVPRASADDDEPKLCPEPGPDQPGSEAASDRAKAYQEQISRMINPQRPLEYGLAMSLTNPLTGALVHFDECNEETGTMIEAKGPGYAGLLQIEPALDNIQEKWLDQASHQVAAAGTRRVEWYFAEQQAADYASGLFKREDQGRERIIIKVQPAENNDVRSSREVILHKDKLATSERGSRLYRETAEPFAGRIRQDRRDLEALGSRRQERCPISFGEGRSGRDHPPRCEIWRGRQDRVGFRL